MAKVTDGSLGTTKGPAGPHDVLPVTGEDVRGESSAERHVSVRRHTDLLLSSFIFTFLPCFALMSSCEPAVTRSFSPSLLQVYLLSGSRLQDLLCLSRQPEPAALHPADGHMVRQRHAQILRHMESRGPSPVCLSVCVCVCVCVCRKNNVDDFIPDRQPDFPDKKFEKVTGDPFFIDESVLVKTKNTSFILLSRRIRCATEASVHSVQFHSHEVQLQDRLSCQNRSSW